MEGRRPKKEVDQNIKVVDLVTDPFVWLLVTEKAKEVYSSGLFTLFVLYDDGSEAQIMSYEDLDFHLANGREIGIEVGHISKSI